MALGVKVTADPERMGIRRPGDPVELGTAIAYALEPSALYARLVGIRHGDVAQPFVVRRYVDGDDWYPTGEYENIADFGLVPWDPS